MTMSDSEDDDGLIPEDDMEEGGMNSSSYIAPLTEKEIEKVKFEIRKDEPWKYLNWIWDIEKQKSVLGKNKKITPTRVLNVLVCGTVGNGKSAAVKVLMDPFYIPDEEKKKGRKKGSVQFSSLSLKGIPNSQNFSVNIIDVPGIFAVQPKDEKEIKQEVQKLIAILLDKQVEYIDTVLFFAKYFTELVKLEFKAVVSLFSLLGKKVPISIVLSHSEDKDDTVRGTSKMKFEKIFQEYCAFNFMGVVHPNDKKYEKFDVLKSYENVFKMRDELLKFITWPCHSTKDIQKIEEEVFEKRCYVKDLACVKTTAWKVSEMIIWLTKTAKKVEDKAIDDHRKELDQYQQKYDYVRRNASYMKATREDAKKFSEFQELISLIRDSGKASASMKKILCPRDDQSGEKK